MLYVLYAGSCLVLCFLWSHCFSNFMLALVLFLLFPVFRLVLFRVVLLFFVCRFRVNISKYGSSVVVREFGPLMHCGRINWWRGINHPGFSPSFITLLTEGKDCTDHFSPMHTSHVALRRASLSFCSLLLPLLCSYFSFLQICFRPQQLFHEDCVHHQISPLQNRFPLIFT